MSSPTPLDTSATSAHPDNPAVRLARYSEQYAMANIFSAAFWDDVLFGRKIHPRRNQYPNDPALYWLRKIQTYWWDWTHFYVVSVDRKAAKKGEGDGEAEIITGVAHWSRMGPGARERGWGLQWWDPRNLAYPLAKSCSTLASKVYPNRASTPALQNILEDSYPFLAHVWTGPHEECWNLEYLAVHPDHQNKGLGRALVAWGLEQARKENVCASVVVAEGKERFYQRAGFTLGPIGWAGEGGEKNQLSKVPGGLVFFREVDIPKKESQEGQDQVDHQRKWRQEYQRMVDGLGREDRTTIDWRL